MKLKYLLLIPLLFVIGCENNKKPEIIVQTKVEYKIIPEEYLVCPATPVYTAEQIEAIMLESQYNAAVVLPFFEIIITCYQNMNRVREWNDFNKQLNNSEIENPS